MKPIHITILVISLVALVLAYFSWENKKGTKSKASSTKDDKPNDLATITTTVIVDPVDNQEYIVSEPGSNPIDGSSGTNTMNDNISIVVNDIDNRTGVQPDSFTLKTYSVTGTEIGSTTINNPLKSASSTVVDNNYPVSNDTFFSMF